MFDITKEGKRDQEKCKTNNYIFDECFVHIYMTSGGFSFSDEKIKIFFFE